MKVALAITSAHGQASFASTICVAVLPPEAGWC
jgi:hypothetical protein